MVFIYFEVIVYLNISGKVGMLCCSSRIYIEQ